MIRFENVTKIYNAKKANAFEALHSISMTIEEGEFVAIVGKSGAGKSTILHILACIDSYEEGEFYLGDTLVKNLNEKQLAHIRNEQIGIVMQDYALVEDFTALQNVMLPLDFAKKRRRGRKQIALDILDQVEMQEFANKPVSQLSGGQKQRVAIARALVNDPDILLADEPTGALDSVNAEAIMDLFRRIHENGTTVVLVTHDMELAARCERKIEIVDGRIKDE
ncbi:MAG: ABC transporter ATP-binding protein [Clostridiales bacterium]|nr:ABC transporter ATP-binding protein [Clostridiales bacterium]